MPRLALTATADRADARATYLRSSAFRADGLIVAGFDRPNIRYHVSQREQAGKQLEQLLASAAWSRNRLCAEPRQGREDRREPGRKRAAVAALSCRSRAAASARATRRRSSVPKRW